VAHEKKTVSKVDRTPCVALLIAVAGSLAACSSQPVATTYTRGQRTVQPDAATHVARSSDPYWIEQAASRAVQGAPSTDDGFVWTGETTGAGTVSATTTGVQPAAYQPTSSPTSRGTGAPALSSLPGLSVGTGPTYGTLPGTTVPSMPGVGQRGETDSGAVTDNLDSLTHVTFATEGADFDPSLSRDGTMMVFASTRHRETADLYSKAVNGSAVRQLTADPAQDVMPAVSPDGKRIAFCSDRSGTWDVFVMSSQGGQAVQLTNTSAHDVHPSWSPDGSRLVFSRLGEMSRRWELWVMDVNSPTTAEFIGYGLFPEFSPTKQRDGSSTIVFQRSRERGDRAFSVWSIDYKPGNASNPTEIASNRDMALVNPTFSPDGQWVVFASVRNPSATTGGQTSTDLWMTTLNGSSRVNLTAGTYENLMPTFSPDGRLYFVSNREGVSNIWSIGTEKAIAAATGGQNPDHAANTTGSGHDGQTHHSQHDAEAMTNASTEDEQK
jgi:TolB protein